MEAVLKPLISGSTAEPLRIGENLRTVRQGRGFELIDVARDTRIPIRHLNALEADDYEKLPAQPYAIGFIRTYSRYLGLNPEEAVQHYKQATYKTEMPVTGSAQDPLDESRLPSRGLVIGSIFAVIGLIALAWFAYAHFRHETDASAPAAAQQSPVSQNQIQTGQTQVGQTQANQPAPVLSQSAAPPVSATPLVPGDTQAQAATVAPAVSAAIEATPAAGAAGLIIRATEDSWIRVSDGGPVSLKIGILKAGDSYSVPSVAGVKLTTGNAGGLEVLYNGKALPKLGLKGELVKNLPLDQASLVKPH